jgi:DNA replication protein DnaC
VIETYKEVIMKRYENIKLQDLKGKYIDEAKKEALELVKNINTYKNNIAFCGDVGTGKTALCYAILNEIWEFEYKCTEGNKSYISNRFKFKEFKFEKNRNKKGINIDSYSIFERIEKYDDEDDEYNFEESNYTHFTSVRITSAKSIIDGIKDEWRDKKDGLTKYNCQKCDVLIIDEIGVQYGTDMERIELFDIIDHRYNEMKPTIFTSNFYKTELKEKLGQRICDRLFSDCKYFEFKEKSKR